jgi:hypothetical protein
MCKCRPLKGCTDCTIVVVVVVVVVVMCVVYLTMLYQVQMLPIHNMEEDNQWRFYKDVEGGGPGCPPLKK